MSQNKVLDTTAGAGPSTSSKLPPAPLRFHNVHSNTIDISKDRSTANLRGDYLCGVVFSDRPVQVNEKICLSYVDIKERNNAGYTCRKSIGFTNVDPATQNRSVPYIFSPLATGIWNQWINYQNYEKDKSFHYYVDGKGQLRYKKNGEKEDVQINTLSKVDTTSPLWAVIQIYGGLRSVQFTDPELDGVGRPNQSQVEDEVRSPNQSQVKDEVRSPNQSQIKDAVRNPNQYTSKTNSLITGPSTSNKLTPLRFHTVHSSIIEISSDRSIAKLTKLFGTASAFSHRPVQFNEKICLRRVDIINQHTETIFNCLVSIGFTSVDPSTLNQSELIVLNTNNPGYWITWFRCNHEKLLYYYVNEKGEVHYGIDGEERGLIKKEVNTGGPLWALIQLYGGIFEVQLTDPETIDTVGSPNLIQVKDGLRSPNQSQVEDKVRSPNQSQIKDAVKRHNQSTRKEDSVVTGPSTSNKLTPLRFHNVHSTSIEISKDRSTAKLTQLVDTASAFSDRPVHINEKVVLRRVDISKRDTKDNNALVSIGFTSFEPSSSDISKLNIQSTNTPRIWIKWFYCHYEKILYYYVNEKGELRYGINGEEQGLIVEGVNTGGPLWAAIQLFGSLFEVQLTDPDTIDAVGSPIQIKDGVRSPNQSQVEDGAISTNQGPSTSNTSRMKRLPPLRFHNVHGRTMEISPDKLTATLASEDSYGAAFSDRPVCVNEKVFIRFVDIKECYHGWACDISIGFTNVDPATQLQSQLYLLYPTMPGYWISWVKLQHIKNDKLLYFYVNRKGEVRYGIDGKEHGLKLEKVNTSGPLWAAIQIYGGLRAVKLTHTFKLDEVICLNHSQVKDGAKSTNQSQVKNKVRSPNQRKVKNGAISTNQSQVNDGVRRPNQNQVDNDPLVNRTKSLSIDTSANQNQFTPLILHRIKSKNIKRIHNGGGFVARSEWSSSKNYVFSARPIRSGQTILVQIIATDQTNQGSLTIGLTSCDPATLTPNELPADVELLQDRPEYWVVYPDAANGLHIDGKLYMTLTEDGKMEIRKNSSDPIAVFHVDNTIKLWAFINICGTTKTIRLQISKGAVRAQQNRNKSKEGPKGELKGLLQENSEAKGSETENLGKDKALPSTSKQNLSECTICLENQVNSVIYKCGHMCMCYNCAMKQWKGKGSASGKCPLCRKVITDVIKTYIP